MACNMNRNIIIRRIQDSINIKSCLLDNEEILNRICQVSSDIVDVIADGGKLLVCGNGGSASDSLHFVAEIVGRFQMIRKGYAAISLNADVATMTAVANDYGFDDIFARQVEGIMLPKDILIAISTSGNSRNVINAVKKANEIGGKTVALSGNDGGDLNDIVDYSIIVPSNVTARIQESHMLIYHIICECVENELVMREIR